MVNLHEVAKKFNKKIASLRPDCYAVVEDNGTLLTVWLDGVRVIKVNANKQIDSLLKPGYAAYKVLNTCFP